MADFPFRRIYLLPVAPSCPEGCSYCPHLGMISARMKTTEELLTSLSRARSGRYDAVLVPCNGLYDFGLLEIVELIKNQELTPLIQLNTQSINTGILKLIHELHERGVWFNILIHDASEEQIEAAHILKNTITNCFFSSVLNRKLQLSRLLRKLPKEWWKDLYFYLPYKTGIFDGNLSCFQLENVLELCRRRFPEFKIRTIPNLDQYDPRISPDLELEPLTNPQMSHEIEGSHDVLISVIIPTYNNQNYIQNTIKHLARQTLDKRKYEVIIVNDGSSDLTGERIEEILSNLEMNYHYLLFKRPRKREMGDAQFRAGIARNLGVKWARGSYLSFLDADIITPSNYLENLLKELGQADLVQGQRLYLKPECSSNDSSYENLNPVTDTFIPEGGYWHDFYQTADRWNDLKAPWKYVCTYALTLKRDLFIDVGWFRKTYMFYGFEDTDLGYRLYRFRKKFLLSKQYLFHLGQRKERSEYSNSSLMREVLLSKTARIFFRNYLEQEIFEELRSMVSDPGPQDLLDWFSKPEVYR